MEDLIDQGVISGVLDLTPHELVAEIFPKAGDIYAPVRPGRLEAAGRRKIPQVIAPGGLDYFVYGPLEIVPSRYKNRKIHFHNPYNVNVRVNKNESKRVGKVMAERLNEAKGPVVVMIPLKGWSEWNKEGGDLYDPEANRAFIESLKKHVASRIQIIEMDCHINDPIFAEKAVSILCNLMEKLTN